MSKMLLGDAAPPRPQPEKINSTLTWAKNVAADGRASRACVFENNAPQELEMVISKRTRNNSLLKCGGLQRNSFSCPVEGHIDETDATSKLTSPL